MKDPITSTLPKIVTNTVTIRFQDCDPFNHLNNGRYIDYFVNHREDMLIEYYDINIYKMAKQLGKSWVTGSNQIAYLKPALLMETVTIESQLIEYTQSDLKVEMRMFNRDKSQLKAVIWCVFTHFNLLEQRREKHSNQLMEFFDSIVLPLEATHFEERIQQIRAVYA